MPESHWSDTSHPEISSLIFACLSLLFVRSAGRSILYIIFCKEFLTSTSFSLQKRKIKQLPSRQGIQQGLRRILHSLPKLQGALGLPVPPPPALGALRLQTPDPCGGQEWSHRHSLGQKCLLRQLRRSHECRISSHPPRTSKE